MELLRTNPRVHPRGDPWYPPGSVGSIGWEKRWQEAAEKSGDEDALQSFKKTGRMVALKSSGVWRQLGTLWGDSIGNPYPPFAFDSGMRTRMVSREDAEELGLIGPDDEAQPQRGLTPPRFLPMEDARMMEWLRNQPEECGHCGEAKPLKLLRDCDSCGESICPECRTRGCNAPEVPEQPATPWEHSNATECFRAADALRSLCKFPLGRQTAEQILVWCDRAFQFGFPADFRSVQAHTHKMRGEALESLGFKDRALREYELAMEKDPQVEVKKRIASLRKECGKE